MKPILLLLGCALLLASLGCGSSLTSPEGERSAGTQHVQKQAQRRAAARSRHARAAVRRQRARLIARQRHRAHMRKVHAEESELLAAEEAEAQEAAVEEETSECDPNYAGACLDPAASDYDCEGGSGNGPYYTGEVTVIGVDHYGLDADGDGIGCEAE